MQRTLSTLCLTLMLGGCGGGGIDAIPKPDLNVDNMLANWTSSTALCVTLGSQSYKEKGIELWWQSYAKVYSFYGNTACNGDVVGTVTDTYDASWSAPHSSRNPKGSARVKLSAPVRTTEGTLPAPLFALDNSDVWALFYVTNNQLQMYTDGLASERDADGYPLGVTAPTASFSQPAI